MLRAPVGFCVDRARVSLFVIALRWYFLGHLNKVQRVCQLACTAEKTPAFLLGHLGAEVARRDLLAMFVWRY